MIKKIGVCLVAASVLSVVACAQSTDSGDADIGVTTALSSAEVYTGPPEDDPSWTATLSTVSRTKTKMIGGDRAGADEWPFLGVLRFRNDEKIIHLCGATAISKRWVLTAAHCVVNIRETTAGSWEQQRSGKLEIVLGVNDLNQTNDKDTFGVANIVVHSNYIPLTEYTDTRWTGDINDIALIELNRDWTGPVMRLSAGGDSDSDQYFGRGFAAGFGSQGNGLRKIGRSEREQSIYAGSQHLIHAMLPLKTADYCDERMGAHGYTAEQNICAAFDDGGIDSCQGDSGGPLAVLDNKGRAYQIGLVSYSDIGCARAQIPGVYVRISHYRPWIEKHAADATFVNASPETSFQVSNESLQAITSMIEAEHTGIDIKILPSSDLKDGDTAKFEITPKIAGRLWILDRSESGKIMPLYPDNDTEIANSVVKVGQTVTIPDARFGDGFEAQISDPDASVERSELIAIVLPPSFELIGDGIPEITKSVSGNTAGYPQRLRNQIAKAIEASEDEDGGWAAKRVPYTISK